MCLSSNSGAPESLTTSSSSPSEEASLTKLPTTMKMQLSPALAGITVGERQITEGWSPECARILTASTSGSPSSGDSSETYALNLGITGSRGIDNYPLVSIFIKSAFRLIDNAMGGTISEAFSAQTQTLRIISGAARGVDSAAAKFAASFRTSLLEHHPDFDTYSKAAGHIRNSLIVRDSDCVLGIWDGTSPGTLNCMETAARKGKLVGILLCRLPPMESLLDDQWEKAVDTCDKLLARSAKAHDDIVIAIQSGHTSGVGQGELF